MFFRLIALLRIAGHMALWAGLYVAAAYVCFAQIAGPPFEASIRPRAMLFCFCTAAAVYLLDRAKLRDAWLDPADAQAHPRRYAFIAGRTRAVRLIIVLLLLVAAGIGLQISPLAAAIPPLAFIGVLFYAARPRGRRNRPKDILLLKSLYVALGITGFAAVVTLASQPGIASLIALADLARASAWPLALSAAHLLIRVAADAVLCDLDDEAADRAHGTRTFPGVLGRRRAWNLALTVRLLLAAALAAAGLIAHSTTCYAWSAVTIISSIALRIAAPAKMRDWVDARFAIEAAAVMIVLAATA